MTTGWEGTGYDPLPSQYRPDVHPEIAAIKGVSDQQEAEAPPGRIVRLASVDGLTMRRTRWLWDQRIPLAAMSLVAGREGIGKSTVVYDLAASITRGVLRGEHFGKPRSVVIVATEDDWEATILPRLTAARTDLKRIFRADVVQPDGASVLLTLPLDLDSLKQCVRDNDVVLTVLDPLMSRLDASLDSHKDAEVRRGLEPVMDFAQATRTSVIGLIHLNKSGGRNLGDQVMGSKAFNAVVRATIFIHEDADNSDGQGTRIVEQVKSNLGPKYPELPNLGFDLERVIVGKDPEDGQDIPSTHVKWNGETDRNIGDLMIMNNDEEDGALGNAKAWLEAFLDIRRRDDEADVSSVAILKEAAKFGHSKATIYRAKKKLGVVGKMIGSPPRSMWSLPVVGVDVGPGVEASSYEQASVTDGDSANTGGDFDDPESQLSQGA